MVLYLFVVAYIGGATSRSGRERVDRAAGPVFAVALAVELCIAFISSGLKALDTGAARPAGAGPFGSPGAIGELLLTDFLLPFEAASFLLLVRPWAPSCSRRPAAATSGPGELEARWTSPGTSSSPRSSSRIGVAGVITRRNPLVVLLCLELMLNAGNLALIAFSRMHGSEAGQIFALIVMVVAACEVVIGLGIIVAMYRNRLPIDVDEMSELRG